MIDSQFSSSGESSALDMIRRIDALARRHDVSYQGCTVRWREWGQGPPLVLLHGGHGSWHHWIRNIEALSATHSVWAPDMPGFGDSQDLVGDRHDPQRQARLVDTLAGNLDTLLGSQTLIDLAGFSFGGLTAGQLAARRGGVTRMALLGPAGHGGTRRQKTALVNWRLNDAVARRAALRNNLQSFLLHEPGSVDALALAIHETAALATRYRSKDFSHSTALTGALQNLSMPLLMLWGEHDVTAHPVEAAQRLSDERPEREWCIMPGAGHWVQYERHQDVNQLLGRWLSPA